MPFSYGTTIEEDYTLKYAELPLPGPAVVIDVRQRSEHDLPLLRYLALAIEDLAREIRVHQVPRWRYLRECIEFVQLDAHAPYPSWQETTDFVLTTPTRSRRPIAIQGQIPLAASIGREYLDYVRNHHIRATKDSGDADINVEATRIDPEHPTVRVFFLVDMDDKVSLCRAASYAQWLKEWTEEQHGLRRHTRDYPLHTIVLCLNTDTSFQHHTLLSTLGQQADSAIDTVLLLQKYGDDEAYLSDEAQHYYVELILYTLLLHWPEELRSAVDDLHAMHALPLLKGAYSLPWPTYTLGIAALEYSARWATRWLDYGVTARLLQVITDADKVAQEKTLIQTNMHKWMQNWWQSIQKITPIAMLDSIDELQGYTYMEQALRDRSFVESTPTTSQAALQAFSQRVSSLYEGQGATLEQALRSAPAILDQLKRVDTHPIQEENSAVETIDEPYQKLAAQYTMLRQCVSRHFSDAWGALPRAEEQLTVIKKEADVIRAIEQNPPKVQALRTDFEEQAQEVSKQLAASFTIWNMPVVGTVLRSTVLSILLLICIGLLLLVGINWQTLAVQFSQSLSSVPQGVLRFVLQCLLVVVLGGCELLYLSMRNQTLHRVRVRLHKLLCNTVQTQLAQTRTTIAAGTAVALLTWANLYTPDKSVAPYLQRLQTLEEQIKQAQKRAIEQQTLVDTRLKLLLGQQSVLPYEEIAWPPAGNRTDLLHWQQVEDAFLQSCQEMTSNSPALKQLAELLLRRMGTENIESIFLSTLLAQPQPDEQTGEERFQVLYSVLVAVFLSLDITPPAIKEVLPLLKQYAIQKEQYLLPTASPGIDATHMLQGIRETMLKHALQTSQRMPFTLKQPILPEQVLVGWVSDQHSADTQLAQILHTNDLTLYLASQRTSIPQALDMLRRQSALLGHPDEIAGDDSMYLLLAPGEQSNAFLFSHESRDIAPVHAALFPDTEKLVYLHLHRIRQMALPTGSREHV